jgi:ribose transport system permease protein
MALVGGRGLYLGMVSRALVLTKLNMLLISLGLQPATMQAAAFSLVIVMLLLLYGRKPAI